MSYETCTYCRSVLLWMHGALVCARRGCNSYNQDATPDPTQWHHLAANPRKEGGDP